MCCKNGAKSFYVLFRVFETSKPVHIITNQTHVYKSLDVFNQFPTPNEVICTLNKNFVEPNSIRVMRIDIPYSKLF